MKILKIKHSGFIFRQLGHRSSVNKLVPLVQSLSQHINVFLVEYNKYNNLQLNLPGFRPTSTNNANNLIDADASGMYFYIIPLSSPPLRYSNLLECM